MRQERHDYLGRIGVGAWEGPTGQTLRSQEGARAGLASEVLSEWVGGWAPVILLPGGAHLQGNGTSKHPTLCPRQPAVRPAPATCPRGLWEEDRSGREWTGARPAQIQDGAALACCIPWPRCWGPAVRQEAAASPETPSQLPSPGEGGTVRLQAGEEGEGRGGRATDLRAGAMHDTWVCFELDPGRSDDRPQLLSCQGPKPYGHHGVQLPMALKDGQVLSTAIGCLQVGHCTQGTANMA